MKQSKSAIRPVIKCVYGCGTGKAGNCITWGEDAKGRFRGVEHFCCEGCGTIYVKKVRS